MWRLISAHRIRTQLSTVLGWLDSTLGECSRSSVKPLSPASFHADLICPSRSPFRSCSVELRFAPRHDLFSWAKWRLKRQEETVTLSGDLNHHPKRSWQLHSLRYVGKTKHCADPASAGWHVVRTTPTIFGSRPELHLEFSSVLAALAQMHPKCLSDVRISSTSPNFTVSIPLSAVAPGCEQRFEVFQAIRSLAASASSLHKQSY